MNLEQLLLLFLPFFLLLGSLTLRLFTHTELVWYRSGTGLVLVWSGLVWYWKTRRIVFVFLWCVMAQRRHDVLAYWRFDAIAPAAFPVA